MKKQISQKVNLDLQIKMEFLHPQKNKKEAKQRSYLFATIKMI